MPWNIMLRAARCVHTYASPSFAAKTPYLMAVPTKQLVWPYLYGHIRWVIRLGQTEIHGHRFWTQRRGDQVHFSSAQFTLQGFLSCRSPLGHFHLDARIFLWADALAIGTIVVHTGLAVFRAIDSIAFAKFYLA